MVRTLDFHSKNVGSIPAGPIIKIYKNSSNVANINKKLTFKYCLNFTSLISPFFFHNLKNNFKNKTNKVFVKESYLIFT